MDSCDGRADCKGYTQSTGCRGAFLFYTDGTVVSGGDPLKTTHSWKRAVCHKKREDWKFKVLGYGKCVTASGGVPNHEYDPNMREWDARRKCAQDAACKGFSAARMNYVGVYFWLEGNLKTGGTDSRWRVSYCVVKEGAAAAAAIAALPSPPPPPAPTPRPATGHWKSLGSGKCLAAGGGEPSAKYVGGLREPSLKQKCYDDPKCFGYSASWYGGGLLWMEPNLKRGGASWGLCRCIVKDN